ncbi:MAG: hypothetical protein WEB67_01365, partial [Acidimicrobiia bacterium]
MTITGSYNGTQTATLTINPPVLMTLSLAPATVIGGSSSTGAVTLSNPAPAGGAIVGLSTDYSVGLEGVVSPSGLPADGSIDWLSLGPTLTPIASGTTVPVAGLPGTTMTFSTANGLSQMTAIQCPGDGCVWYGNFTPGTTILWTGGAYEGESWVGNVPLILTFSSPQRGVGFQIMPDLFGSFTATLCAYDAADTLLGCVPFAGSADETNTDGSAIFAGLYGDAQQISKVTVHAGGSPTAQGVAIGSVVVANAQRQMVPLSVLVPEGATTATFPVSTTAVSSSMTVNIAGSYNGIQTAALTINPAVLTAISLDPASLVGGETSTGTATLNGPAPAGGAVVALSSDSPIVPGIELVTSFDDLPLDGSVDWAVLGASLTPVPSGTSVPIAG